MPELTEVEVDEVSFVAKAANRRKWLLLKSDDGEVGGATMPGLESDGQRLEAVLNEATEDEEKLVEQAVELAKGDLPPEDRDLIRAASRILKAAPLVGKLLAPAPAKKGTRISAPEPPPAPQPASEEILKMAEAAGVDRVALTKAASEGDIAVLALTTKHQATENAVLRKSMGDLLAKEDDAAVRTLVTEMNLPGDSEQITAFVKSLTPEQRTKWQETHQSAATIVQKSALFTSKGTDRRGTFGDSAMDKAKQLAREVKKGEEPGPDEIMAAMKANPELYEQYRLETLQGGS